MPIGRDPMGALRSILASVEAADQQHKAQVFQQFCGPVTFNAGTYRAKCCRIVATCTAGEVAAVEAWARKAREAIDQK